MPDANNSRRVRFSQLNVFVQLGVCVCVWVSRQQIKFCACNSKQIFSADSVALWQWLQLGISRENIRSPQKITE